MRTDISISARAKLNLGLRILGRRADGFHSIRSVFNTISLHDRIRISAIPGNRSIHLTVTDPSVPANRKNLVWKASEAFMKATDLRLDVSICLEKRIPSAAGLGGGSSDAAAVLLGLSRITGSCVPGLHRIAAELGSDVPFFLTGGAALVEGRGERITPVSCPSFWVTTLHLPISVSTPWAYSLWDTRASSLTKGASTDHCSASVKTWHEGKPFPLDLRNDFLPLLCDSFPVIAETADRLRASCDSWGLSGSGPTLFALFRTEEESKRMADEFRPDMKTIVSRSTSDTGA